MPQVVPGVVGKLFQPLTIENLLLSGVATTNAVRYATEGTATSGAAGVAEGGVKRIGLQRKGTLSAARAAVERTRPFRRMRNWRVGIEARISHLAYAPEIAASMLQRQQAGAIIAAHTTSICRPASARSTTLRTLTLSSITRWPASASPYASFTFQVVYNITMSAGLAPVKGLTLPLMSYGGSSMIATLAAFGLVLNVRMRRFTN